MSVLASPAGAAEVTVAIRDMAFIPQRVEISPGDTVTWVNEERRTGHDVAFADGVASERLMPGDTFSRRFDATGSYPYLCTPHQERPAMRGEVVVRQ